MCGNIRFTWFSFLLSAILSAASPPSAYPAEFAVGDVQTVTVITISIAVGSTEHEVKRVTYAPPPGWYVRSHRVECKEKTGHSSFTVNTLPCAWSFLSEESVRASYHALFELASQSSAAGVKAKLNTEQERTLAEVRKATASHHVLMVEATAKGEGLFHSGGSLQLTVTAELVYVGTKESLPVVKSDNRQSGQQICTVP